MTEGTGFRKKWMHAGRAIERILGGPWASSETDADYQLYNAVIEGEVRARINGKPFTNFKKLKENTWFEGNIWALPADLELNLDDIDRIWDWDVYDLADLIATNRIGAISAGLRAESAILNLDVLLRRVSARLPAMTLDKALEETNFQDRWEKYNREFKLLRSTVCPDFSGEEDLDKDYKELHYKREKLLEIASVTQCKSKRGAKPKYNWNIVESHIQEKFEYNGPLSLDDPDWSCQADVEKVISEFILSEYGKEPAPSTARKKAKSYIAKFMVDKSII